MLRVRPVTEEDFPAIQSLDLTYDTKRRLSIDRAGSPSTPTLTFRYIEREGSQPAVYARPDSAWLASALERADRFLLAEVDGLVVGYLIVLVPEAGDQPASDLAAEITDLAVDRSARQKGAGRTLVAAAVDWARQRSYRALSVEPRADNAAAIEFYVTLGFRLSGFNDRLYSNSDHEPGETTLFMHLDLR